MQRTERIAGPRRGVRLRTATRAACLAALAACLAACAAPTPPDPNGPSAGDPQTIATPTPVLDPANGSPHFPGSRFDAFGLQATPDDLDDAGGGERPLSFVTNPLHAFHDAGSAFAPLLLVRDVDNPANPRRDARPQAQASWTFDTTGFRALTLTVELAAKGDFEEADRFELTYAFDDGAERSALGFAVDETEVQSYALFGDPPPVAATDTLFDPLVVTDADGARLLTNRFSAFRAGLEGSGERLTVRLKASQDGGTEMLALRNLVLQGTKAE